MSYVVSGRALLPVSGLVLSILASATPALASGTVAGSSIKNIATATYDLPNGGTGTVSSNEVSIRVDELLDVGVASTDGGNIIVTPGATNRMLTFRVTNAGNGSEAFAFVGRDTVSGDNFDPSTTSIVLDSNGNGTFDPGVDTVYVAGANDPLLAPDASITVFVLSSIPAASDGQTGRVELLAAAVTGIGAPGTSFAGQGQGGGNAVVGATGADGQDVGTFQISSATILFVKSATVADPFGGATQVPGSIVTYSLVASVSGSGSLANLKIGDAIPAGSTYQSNSLTLGGTSLTDIVDADAGEFASGGIAVRLGTVVAGAIRTVTFQVKIN